eukprot:gnl/TRDRNA2_/TRDRNA2_35252_c0_seq1.p1 gnl/TRDRNA2_/TRDRNA2_35252_c0~~gnl/TRDRNA2_/TRDRNA2_35252_c0_seq1.p1  ORF type:complete len:377 (-),score=74.93 gnl/TRDRNA2_/TRDRNA2_35252_c0_seq1:52-1182(-)
MTGLQRGVCSVQHADALPEAAAACALLERVRRNAEAVLRARGWRVLELVELCCCKVAPESGRANVAGWCMPAGDGSTAKRIALRLRQPKGRGHGLLPFEEILGTMMHEMAHIVHMKHSAAFYQLMDELSRQWEQLEASGRVLDETGFPTIGGHRLSVEQHNPGSAEGRARALAAAEKRARLSGLMGRPGGRLLGHGQCLGWVQLSPRERAARAAERRAAEASHGFGDDELPEFVMPLMPSTPTQLGTRAPAQASGAAQVADGYAPRSRSRTRGCTKCTSCRRDVESLVSLCGECGSSGASRRCSVSPAQEVVCNGSSGYEDAELQMALAQSQAALVNEEKLAMRAAIAASRVEVSVRGWVDAPVVLLSSSDEEGCA